jgi:hypothetical protein
MLTKSRSRTATLRHVLTIAAAATAAIVICAPAVAQSPQTVPGSVPILKGSYVLTYVENCVAASGSFNQEIGSLSFSPNDGTVKIDGYVASGDPLSLNHFKGSDTYSNSGATFTIGSITYQVAYGKLEKGIATYLSFLTVASNGCGDQGWLSRQ